jgi:hypothetical protein
LRRFARPDEIARAALFILQDDYYTAGSSRSMVGCGCDLPAAMIGT